MKQGLHDLLVARAESDPPRVTPCSDGRMRHKPSLAASVIARIEVREDGCWEWTGARTRYGYAQISLGRVEGTAQAHRVVYELLVAPIPPGLVIDHLCYRPTCVNPAHLEPVTIAENTRRGYAIPIRAAQALAKPTCVHGHPRTPENLRVDPKSGARNCRPCGREANRRYAAKRAAQGEVA